MSVTCPKCQFENTSDSKFCKECGTRILPSNEISVTKTLGTPIRRLEIGSIFAGRYEILEELGKGGMGEVYRVKDKTLDEEMALKVLKPEIAADRDIIERFKNELKLARKIAHKHVCKMYDLNEEQESPYITMEYVEGEDLKNVIRRKGKLTQEGAVSMAKQVCEGLAGAHELGVIHRDLKPQNIMIDKTGDAKIMDFGIARSVEASGVTQSGVMIGTPDYMSPEQAEGEEADQKSDIYSLGVILYEMVTGNVPFRGDTALSVALKHKAQLPQEPKKQNPEVSGNLNRLILVCMEKDKKRRYQTAIELLNDIKNIEEGFPLGTKIRPRRATIVSTLIQKKFFVPALAVIIAIIALIIWQLLQQKGAIPTLSDKPSLAVMYFENNTGEDNLDYWRKMFSDLLISDLSQSKHLRVLSGERLFEILNELNQVEIKTYSLDILQKVAERGRINHLILGKYAKLGDTIRINIQLQDAISGEILASERIDASGENEIFPKVDELTKRMKVSLNLTDDQIASDIDREVETITTSSTEAYKYYREGMEYLLKADFLKCIPLMETAVAIDPEFAMAYRSMGVAYANMGNRTEALKRYQKAFELSNRVSERERYYIQGNFYFFSEKTYDKALMTYRELLKLYPDDSTGNNNLGALNLILEEWDEAIPYFMANIQNGEESYTSYANASTGYVAKGEYDKAKEILKLYLNDISDSSFIHFRLAYIYIFQRAYDSAQAEAERALALDPNHYNNLLLNGDISLFKGDLITAEKEYQTLLETDEPVAHQDGFNRLSALYLLQGMFEKSKEHAQLGIELGELHRETDWSLGYHLNLAYLQFKSKNFKEALKACEAALNISSEADLLSGQREAMHLKGRIFLEMDMLEEAQEVADVLKRLLDSGSNRKAERFYLQLIGMIELKRKNFQKAIQLLKQAVELLPSQSGPEYGQALFFQPLALAYFESEDLDKAQNEYEQIVSLSTGRLFYGDIYAKSFFMLGRIHEQQGDTAKAIEYYEKFLNLWKDADPGIAEVEDARKRLAGLS
jgi:serine/threonine protein kinase/Tfp pilus assembly protein PilF